MSYHEATLLEEHIQIALDELERASGLSIEQITELVEYGVFQPVPVIQQQFGPFVLAYESATAPHSEAATVIARVRDRLERQHGIRVQRTFGIFFPENRMIAGAVLNGVDEGKIKEIAADTRVIG